MSTLLTDAHIAAMDDAGTELAGWILVEDGLVSAVGDGPRPEAGETTSLGGALVTPGLVNTHHHLYQT
ncbi:MAG: 8-oxoguanine deaminase, partial [Gaiellaceae bacterium]